MARALIPAGIGLIAALVASQLTNEFHLRILFSIATYFLCAAGMNVLLGFAGQKSLGQAGLFAAGAYTVALMTTKWGFGPWVAFVAAMGVAGVFGVLIAVVGCFKGFEVTGGTEGVGKATTETVAITSVAVCLSDFFLTKLFLAL